MSLNTGIAPTIPSAQFRSRGRVVTRKTKKDFWKPIDQLIYIDNANNARKADRIANEGIEYLKALIGHKHAQNWADRLEDAA